MTVTITYSGKAGIGLRSGHLHVEGLQPSLSQHVRGLTCHPSPAKPAALLFDPRLVPSWLPVTLSCSHSSAIPLPHSQLKSRGLKAHQRLPTSNGMVHSTTCRSPFTGARPNRSASSPSPGLHRSLTQSRDSPTRQQVPCDPPPCVCQFLEQDACVVITCLQQHQNYLGKLPSSRFSGQKGALLKAPPRLLRLCLRTVRAYAVD